MRISIMLTGATGFIGSHIANALLSHDIGRLIIISREPVGYKNTCELASMGALVYNGSFYDYTLIDKIINETGIHTIVHCAALRGGGIGSTAAYDEINVKGTEILLDAAVRNGVKKFVFISSVGVHGTIPVRLPTGSDADFNSDNLYHASKINAENAIRSYSNKGLDILILRPTITYGRGDSGGFPTTLVKLVKNRVLLLPIRKVLIHLLDAKAIAHLVANIISDGKRLNGAYIVADEAPVELSNLVDIIHQKIYGKAYPRILHIPAVVYDIMAGVSSSLKNEKWASRFKLLSRSWYYDISDTISSFGFKPSRTLDAFIDVIG